MKPAKSIFERRPCQGLATLIVTACLLSVVTRAPAQQPPAQQPPAQQPSAQQPEPAAPVPSIEELKRQLEAKRLELKRQGEAKRQLDAKQQIEAKQQVEAKVQAEEKRQLEAKQEAEAKQQAEEKRQLDAKLKAEAKQQAEEKRQLEAKLKAEAKQQAEEKRQLEAKQKQSKPPAEGEPTASPVPAPAPAAPAVLAKSTPIPKNVLPVRLEPNSEAVSDSCPYPVAARNRGETGTVVLLIYVTPDGHATDTSIETSSGSEALDEGAATCVKEYGHFLPKRVGARAEAGWFRMRFKWSFGD